ncbi:hypothetical protein DMN91_007987 [Ooceraea biroi]|uniref:Uncharacterized protein n=1 Tax=Ooceraea biroi TaxID=2015173 RepID=A0A3L8DG56_OOCBI|nr:hypothetical protein DMN91_007987 [Ooceraea biroi]
MKAPESVLQKVEDLSHLQDHNVFNYISCPKKPRLAINIIYKSCLKWNRYPKLFCYTIFVDYAVEHIGEIIRVVKEYNAADSDKNKLLFLLLQIIYIPKTNLNRRASVYGIIDPRHQQYVMILMVLSKDACVKSRSKERDL